MNQRIRELAEQAARYSATMFLPTGENGNALFVEKFAELIVRECVELIRDSDWAYDVPDDDYDPNAVAMIAADGVAKHFGVES